MKYQPPSGIDLTVMQTLRLGMDSGTFLRIEYVYGFEMFGAYETWRGGWRITDPQVMDFRMKRRGTLPLQVQDERLEQAIAKWVTAREESKKAEAEVPA